MYSRDNTKCPSKSVVRAHLTVTRPIEINIKLDFHTYFVACFTIISENNFQCLGF